MIQFNNPARLEAVRGYDKRLVAARGAGGTIELKSFRTMSDEADAVAAEIAAALEYRERPPGHFAILARTHGHLDPFASALKARGIRFQRSSDHSSIGPKSAWPAAGNAQSIRPSCS